MNKTSRVRGRRPPPDGAGAGQPSHHAVEPWTWCTWREACAVAARPYHLRRTITIALVVGTILFAINQLDVVLRGDADTGTWVKVAVTYLVPFCVSSAGLLVGTHRPTDQPTAGTVKPTSTTQAAGATPLPPGQAPPPTNRPDNQRPVSC